MRKHAAATLLILLLSVMTSFAQSSPGATSAVDKNKIISNLLERIDANELLIKTLTEREQALTDEIAKADEAHAELTTAHKAALLELGELRATIKFTREANDDLKKQVELWRSEATRLNKELKASRKRELILLLGLIARSVIGR
jgi:peptidoglycan hydrolase CwlO-like protein